MKFSLLTFNTQGTPLYSPYIRERYKKFSGMINKTNPDIICFQEISTYYNLFLLKKYLKYPYFYFKPFLHAPKGGLVIASKIPLVDIAFVDYKTNLPVRGVSFWSHVIRNGMLTARIKDTSTTIVNTHTFSDFEFEWSTTNKLYRFVKTQIEQLATQINKLSDNEQSIIMVGDLNSKKNSTLYKYLLHTTKMIDIFGDTSSPTYYKDRLDYKFRGKTSERIDHVLLKSNKNKIKTTSRSHLFNDQERLANKKNSYLSDHIGLLVSFDIV